MHSTSTRSTVNIYSSFHRSILAYFCHNSMKTASKATVMPNECCVLKIAWLPHHQRYPRIDQSASIISVTSWATSGFLSAGRVSPPKREALMIIGKYDISPYPRFRINTHSSWDKAYFSMSFICPPVSIMLHVTLSFAESMCWVQSSYYDV